MQPNFLPPALLHHVMECHEYCEIIYFSGHEIAWFSEKQQSWPLCEANTNTFYSVYSKPGYNIITN